MKFKENNDSCNPELISRFFDGELEEDAQARVIDHLRICSVCRERLETIQAVSTQVKKHIEAYAVDPGKVEEEFIGAIHKKETPWWERGREIIISKKIMVPAGAVASFLLIFFSIYFNSAVSEPSAIITSVSGNGTSLIVMETPETRQTILWFNEKG